MPGVEYLKTNAGERINGLCLEEFAPFGVIGIITPGDARVPTLTANAINMVAAGNAIVCNPHPSGAQLRRPRRHARTTRRSRRSSGSSI